MWLWLSELLVIRTFSVPDCLDNQGCTVLRCDDTQVLCKWLCCFVLETRKEDGSPYPPSTLRSLVSGLNRIIKRNNIPFSVLDKTDHRFRDLLKTLDSVSSDLHRQGVGASRNSAPVIDQKDEDLFWEKGLLGYNPPKVLQRTVFFYIGLNFVLRGTQEQYDLTPSQLQRVPADCDEYNDTVYYKYTEYISKNNQHRFKDINSSNKSVMAYMLNQAVSDVSSSSLISTLHFCHLMHLFCTCVH